MQQPRQRFMMLSLIFFITNPPHCMAFVPASGALSATTMTRRTGQGACSLRSIIKTDGSEPARRSATDVVVRQPYLGFASLHFQSVPLRLTRHCGCAVEHRTLSAWRLCPLSRCLCRSSKVRELFKSMLRVCMHCSVPQRSVRTGNLMLNMAGSRSQSATLSSFPTKSGTRSWRRGSCPRCSSISPVSRRVTRPMHGALSVCAPAGCVPCAARCRDRAPLLLEAQRRGPPGALRVRHVRHEALRF
jgi:hypothetical protein